MIDPNKKLWLIASDQKVAIEANELFRRVRECMIAYERFMKVAVAADENNPADMDKVGDAAFQLAARVVQQYPNPAQFDADMATLRGMRVQIEPLPKV